MRNQEVTLVAIDKENFRNGTSLLDSMIHEKVVGTPGDNSLPESVTKLIKDISKTKGMVVKEKVSF